MNTELGKDWLNMSDLKKHTFNNKVWIPLYAQYKKIEFGKYGHEYFREEFLGAHSIIIPKEKKEKALELEWSDVALGDDKPWVDRENVFHNGSQYNTEDFSGEKPVFIQYIEVERKRYAYFNSDLILGLGLKQDGDKWVCPEEDYVEVIRVTRDTDGEPVLIEIKAEFLKDYLCAKSSGLVLLTYQSRQAIEKSFNGLEWTDNDLRETSGNYHWNGRLLDVSEGLFGYPVQVFHMGRTDTDYTEDIPVYGFPTDEGTFSNSYTVEPTGQKLIHADSELWNKEWIEPSIISPRVRDDEVISNLEFIIDNSGDTEKSQTLAGPSRWLWFHPEVMNDLLKKPNGQLEWYTEDTGRIGGAWNRSVHFGVNTIGLINVYAKDIGNVREIDKKVWAKHNVSPEGKVSPELLMSQMQARPAETYAPEEAFFGLIGEMESIFKMKFGYELFIQHDAIEDISKKIHRFQTTSLHGFFFLCKEITRFLIERIDMDSLKKIKKEAENLGTLKRLENILTILGYDGRKIMGVFAGVYDLRLADAHLPSDEKIRNALVLVGIDYDKMKFNSGKQLIENINNSLSKIIDAFLNGNFSQLN